MLRRLLCVCFVLGVTAPRALTAAVRPHPLFSEHAVLQQAARVPVWGTAAPGEKITVALGTASTSATADANGAWRAEFSALTAGGPFTLTIAGDQSPAPLEIPDVLVGEAWLCAGASNMEMSVARGDRPWCGVLKEAAEISSANFPSIRCFTVALKMSDAPQTEPAGKWVVCSPSTVGEFSATAYFFARELHQKLNRPVGVVVAAYGASTAEAWTSRPALEALPDLRSLLNTYTQRKSGYDPEGAPARIYRTDLALWQTEAAAAKAAGRDRPREPKSPDPMLDEHNPSVLFNGMIAPLVPFALRGVVWYQGEANYLSAAKYPLLLKTLVADWRAHWGAGDLPFLYVQLANHLETTANMNAKTTLAPLRDAQLQTLAVPGTGMAVTIDLGDTQNPHPKNKQEVGRRLGLIARAQVYGEAVPFSGPIFESTRTEDGAVRLRFKHMDGGLAVHGTDLTGFALAGVDQKFVAAEAIVDGDSVLVANGGVVLPATIRYGWADNPACNLYNGAGLPASPFRAELKTQRD